MCISTFLIFPANFNNAISRTAHVRLADVGPISKRQPHYLKHLKKNKATVIACFAKATVQSTTVENFYVIMRSVQMFSVHYETVCDKEFLECEQHIYSTLGFFFCYLLLNRSIESFQEICSSIQINPFPNLLLLCTTYIIWNSVNTE